MLGMDQFQFFAQNWSNWFILELARTRTYMYFTKPLELARTTMKSTTVRMKVVDKRVEWMRL